MKLTDVYICQPLLLSGCAILSGCIVDSFIFFRLFDELLFLLI
ncbi:hypothetical protein PROSTU_03205 [Providencia stuartii ATCC 25827]|uniref:Lipoprotein n=1 Tax=Providencia stuartii ATCC 25827 TaxID=471874 RepID=A0AA86YXN4_PROST|nr:hypothetical protein PROSTU_03205 [Providencia stuartii ATCC 25827]